VLLPELLRVRRFGALAVMLAGGLASVAQLWPRPGGQIVPYKVQLDTVWYALSAAFYPERRVEAFLVPALLTFVLVALAIGRHRPALVLLLASAVPIMLVYLFVWMGGVRHAGILLLLAVMAIWIADAYGPLRFERQTFAALAIALALSTATALQAVVRETREAYSGSAETAAFLRETGLDRVELVVPQQAPNSVLAYLPGKRFWCASTGSHGSFIPWSREWQRPVRIDDVVARAEGHFGRPERQFGRQGRHFGRRKWLLLVTSELPERLRGRFRLLHQTQRPVWRRADERFWLYEPRGGP
jgi:hypothetical protein